MRNVSVIKPGDCSHMRLRSRPLMLVYWFTLYNIGNCCVSAVMVWKRILKFSILILSHILFNLAHYYGSSATASFGLSQPIALLPHLQTQTRNILVNAQQTYTFIAKSLPEMNLNEHLLMLTFTIVSFSIVPLAIHPSQVLFLAIRGKREHEPKKRLRH